MIGLGTLINAGGVLIGGLLGFLFRKGMKERFQQTLMNAAGVSTLFLAIAGVMEKMLKMTEDGLTSGGTMMIIASLCLGGLIGELLNIERRFEQFGEWLKKITKSEKDNDFIDGFVTTSLTICIGAMAVIGSIQDGINGDYSILAAKAVLDLILVMIMTASKGKGCIFSVIPIIAMQGSMTLLAKLIQPILTTQAMNNLSLVGSILIFCVGVNLVWGKKVKVANFLPAIIIAVAWAFLPFGQ